MKWQQVRQTGVALWHEGVKTTHSRIVTFGLVTIGFGYLPFRMGEMIMKSLQGQVAILILVIFFFGLYLLWQQRKPLAQMRASEDDQFVGHLLVLVGIILFLFFLFTASLWSQTIVVILILAGIACSTWGAAFFIKFPLPTFLICLGLVPNPGILARVFWETFVPPLMLERFTAWLGLLGLMVIGQEATIVGDNIISLPGGSVSVSWGCTGFNMAMSVAVAGLLIGLFFKQTLVRTVLLMAVGIVIALILNIPRMVLLALAEVHWGKDAFHYWHDGWGAQIFSATLFTIYYYAAMPLVNQKSTKSPS